jgi:hypothetical protein
MWHDELKVETVGTMPVSFPNDIRLRNRIVRIVEELQAIDLQPEGLELGGVAAQRKLPTLERELDDAIFDLYELNAAERDLVREMCSIGLDLFYRHQKSDALREIVRPTRGFGTLPDLAQADDGLAAYLRTFLEVWNGELRPDGEFAWRILSPPSRAPLLAVCFTTHYKKNPLPKPTEDDGEVWRKLLTRLEEDSFIHASSSRIFIDTFFRHVSDREVLLIKRNERRFWTRTAAREDAQSTLAYLMNLENTSQGGKQ